MSRLERVALLGSVMTWVGAILLGAGLLTVFRNQALNRQAYAQATAMVVASPTASVAPTSTEVVYPAGWATATPTVRAIASVTPTSTQSAGARVTGLQATARATSTPQAVAEAATTDRDATLHAPNESGGASTGGASVQQAPQPAPPPQSGPPERIIIPSIELDQPVVAIGLSIVEQGGSRYAIWDVADYAVSWHKTSAYPGHAGNVVLNGHNNIKGEVFRDLIDVEVGDRVILYVGDQVFTYVVEEKMILKEKGEPPEVQRQNASWIGPTDAERLTMVTCWPYTSNTHRLIVIASPADPLPDTGLQQ